MILDNLPEPVMAYLAAEEAKDRSAGSLPLLCRRGHRP